MCKPLGQIKRRVDEPFYQIRGRMGEPLEKIRGRVSEHLHQIRGRVSKPFYQIWGVWSSLFINKGYEEGYMEDLQQTRLFGGKVEIKVNDPYLLKTK